MCFFKAWSKQSPKNWCYRLSVECNPLQTSVGGGKVLSTEGLRCCPNVGTHLSLPQWSGPRAITGDMRR